MGDPLCIRVDVNMTIADVVQRIQTRLQIPDEEFAKWKFYLVKSFAAVEDLHLDDVISDIFPRQSLHDLGGVNQTYLGLYHAIKHSSKRAATRVLQAGSIKIQG